MIIRHYGPGDEARVQELHAKQGFDYILPDLESPAMLVRVVIEESGIVSHAAFLKKTAEAYWLFDPAESKRQRLGKLLALAREMTPEAKKAGLEEVHAWLPPQIVDKALDRTMLHLGWSKPGWICYCRKVE